MDKFLHFTISAILTYVLLALFFSVAPQLHVETWQLSSAQTERRRRIVLGTVLSVALIVVLGVWKEWGDSLGLGNLETMDFVADVAGVAAAYIVSISRLRRGMERPEYRVRLHQRFGPGQSPAPDSTHKGPRLRSKIRKGNLPGNGEDG